MFLELVQGCSSVFGWFAQSFLEAIQSHSRIVGDLFGVISCAFVDLEFFVTDDPRITRNNTKDRLRTGQLSPVAESFTISSGIYIGFEKHMAATTNGASEDGE